MERWTLARFLGSFADDPLLSYPLSISKRESPDFEFRLLNSKFGVEHTLATHEDLQRARSDAYKSNDPDLVIEASQFQSGTKLPKGSKERPKLTKLSKGLWSEPFVGTEPEKQWVQYIVEAVVKKTQALTSGRYERFQEDWLLIGDETPVGGMTHAEISLPMLKDALKSYWLSGGYTKAIIDRNRFFALVDGSGIRMVEALDISPHSP
jgi:hypothetical protein